MRLIIAADFVFACRLLVGVREASIFERSFEELLGGCLKCTV